jgi:hypothetical protein
MFHRFLSTQDAKRALKSIQKLSHHDIRDWVLVGGLAVEIHWLGAGQPAVVRILNDIDFIAPAFGCIPETLADDFLFRHVHPLDPPGKMMLQLVDAETALRIEVFRADEASLTRALAVDFPSGPIRLAPREDVLARAARLLLDLHASVPVSVKHAQDYVRLKKVTDLAAAEMAWQSHRKAEHPTTFQEANSLIEVLMKSRRQLLLIPEYSKDVNQACPRCVSSRAFPLADPQRVLSLLGYC